MFAATVKVEISKEALIWVVQHGSSFELGVPEKIPAGSSECEECWGSGFFKGWGASCSKGCKA